MDLYIERDGIFKFGINKREGYVVCFFDKATIKTLEKLFLGMRLSVEPYPVGGITNKQWEDAMGYAKTWHQEFIEECDGREIKINSIIRDIIRAQSVNLYKISHLSGAVSISKDSNIKVAKELAKFKLMNEYAKSVTYAIKRSIEIPEVAETNESEATKEENKDK